MLSVLAECPCIMCPYANYHIVKCLYAKCPCRVSLQSVLMLCVLMLIIILLCVLILIIILLNVPMLGVLAECPYAMCPCASFHKVKCLYAEFRYTECPNVNYLFRVPL